MNATMQEKMIAAGVVEAPAPEPKPEIRLGPGAARKEIRLINPVAYALKQSALESARAVAEATFDLVHHDYLEKRKNKDGVEYERRTLVYERYTFKGGQLEAYLYSDPRMGLTAEEREVMFGSTRPRRER